MTSLWRLLDRLRGEGSDEAFLRGLTPAQEADLGMSRAELADFLSGRDDTRERLERMAARFGVSPEELDAERWRIVEITRACGHCREEAVCRRFLEGDGAPAEAEAFCPNAALYRAMREGREEQGRGGASS